MNAIPQFATKSALLRSPRFQPNTSTKDSMASPALITVGLIGFGTGSSVFHAPLLQSSGKFAITHVLERSTSKSSVLQPAPQIVRSMDELLAAPVELIVISTPTHVHFEQAKQAILAKKHVVVDKPLVITASDAQELVDLAKQHGVLFAVFQNRRWDSDFLTVRSLIDAGTLGEITKFESHFDRYRPTLKGYWKEKAELGGGVLYDLGAHLVDQALQLFGEPDSVNADVQIQREGAENDDYFRLEFKYNARPQLQVVLTAGMMVKDLGPKYIIEGSKGKFEKYGEDIQEPQLREGKRPGDSGFGCEPESTYGKFVSVDGGEAQVIPSKTGTYEVYYNNIAAAIRSGEKLLVNPSEVVPQIRILEEAKKTERYAAFADELLRPYRTAIRVSKNKSKRKSSCSTDTSMFSRICPEMSRDLGCDRGNVGNLREPRSACVGLEGAEHAFGRRLTFDNSLLPLTQKVPPDFSAEKSRPFEFLVVHPAQYSHFLTLS